MEKILKELFPSSKWKRYETKYLNNTLSISYQRALEINEKLSSLSIDDVHSLCGINSKSNDKISTQKVRKNLFPDLKENEWKQAIREFKEDEFLSWGIDGRSFFRRV